MNLKERIALAGSAIVIACTPAGPVERQPSATSVPSPTSTVERVIPTPTRLPTSTPVRTEITPTRSPFAEIDLNNRLLLEQLKSGETTVLENAFISRIIRTPMVGVGSQGKDAYIVVLGAEDGSNFDAVFRGDCIRDSFTLQELGPATDIPLTRFATWDTNKRIDRLTIEAGYLIKAVESSHRGIYRDCHVGEITQETEAILRRIPWKELPREAGRLLGLIFGEFGRGAIEGFNQPTPRPTNKIVFPVGSNILI